jgi:predicted RNA-binding Zn ribbon-like protein
VTGVSRTGAIADMNAEKLPRFEFLAGRLSLDFCNSHSRATGGDRLQDGPALAAWAARGGRPLAQAPSAAEWQSSLELRDRLCRVFDALLDNASPSDADLDALAAAALPVVAPALRWDQATRRAIITTTGNSVRQLCRDIAADAVDLLTGDQVERIKRCPSDACHWFFFDSSRNGRRRWCAMADCGTKAKVRHFRARHGAASSAC